MIPIIAGIEGTSLSERERALFSRLQPAGYILFSRNIADFEQTRELTDELRALDEGDDPPVIAIDQEGGRVVRTAAIGVQHPSAAELAAAQSSRVAALSAFYTAQCLQTLGVNTNFAPVLDLGSARANALPGRCWGKGTQSVISLAGAWNRAFFRMGIATCGKHFPGMGEAKCDPHYDLPVLHGSKDDFLAGAAVPFMALMPELPSLMIAHLMLPEIDPVYPSSLSSALVRDFLRGQLGYEGAVFTDDLCMGAIARQYAPAEAAARALLAGCDLPLICHRACDHLEAAAEAVSRLPDAVLREAADRIGRFRFHLATVRAKTFLEWDTYLGNLRSFNETVPKLETPGAASPVQSY